MFTLRKSFDKIQQTIRGSCLSVPSVSPSTIFDFLKSNDADSLTAGTHVCFATVHFVVVMMMMTSMMQIMQMMKQMTIMMMMMPMQLNKQMVSRIVQRQSAGGEAASILF